MFGVDSNVLASVMNSFSMLLSSIPQVAVIAWIASRTDDPAILGYLAVGGPLMVVWNIVVFRTGWALLGELFEGTLDLALVSRTPLILVTLGKSFALIVFTTLLGATSSVLVFLAIVGRTIEIPSLPILAVSFIVAIVSLMALSFVFAPFGVLVGGRPGFMNAIMPAGVVFSGFLYPTSLFSPALESIARILPSAWAMDGVLKSVRGAPFLEIATTWGIALALSAVYLGGTYFLFKMVEARVRVTGALNTF